MTVTAIATSSQQSSFAHSTRIYAKEIQYEFLKTSRNRMYSISTISFPVRNLPAVCQKGAFSVVAASIRRATLCSAAAKLPVLGATRHMPKYSTRHSNN